MTVLRAACGRPRSRLGPLVLLTAVLVLGTAACADDGGGDAASAPTANGADSTEQTPAPTDEAEPTPAPTDDGQAGGTLAPDGDDGSGEQLTFVAVDIDYAQAPDAVAPGEHVFRLVNEGLLPHDVTIEQLGDRTVAEAAGGETAEGRVELEPGTYTYYCGVPGHRLAGMEGTLEVAEGAG